MWKRQKKQCLKTLRATVQLLTRRRAGFGIRWSVCESALKPTKQQQHLQRPLAPPSWAKTHSSKDEKQQKPTLVQKEERIWCQCVDDGRSAAAGDLT